MIMPPGIERNVSSKSVSHRAFRLLASWASLVSSLMGRVGSAAARSDASFTALTKEKCANSRCRQSGGEGER
jgi:hypothetical protein